MCGLEPYWALEERGSETPAWAQARIVRPLQSKAFSPIAPLVMAMRLRVLDHASPQRF